MARTNPGTVKPLRVPLLKIALQRGDATLAADCIAVGLINANRRLNKGDNHHATKENQGRPTGQR